MTEQNPQPVPAPIQRTRHGSILQRLNKHKLWLGGLALIVLFMWKSKSTPDATVRQKQSLSDSGQHTGGKPPTDLSGQKLPDGVHRITDKHSSTSGNERRDSRAGQKSKRQEAQEALLYKSLYGVNFVSTPIPTAQVKAEAEPAKAAAPSAPVPSEPKEPTEKRKALDFDPHQPLLTLPEGMVVEMALDGKLEGEMTGPVDCHVTTDVYAPGTRTVVIPAGSRVSGESNKVGSFGQQRLLVTFHRIMVFDKLGKPLYSIPLDPKEPGLDQQGGMGVTGKINNHVASTVLSSLAVGILGAGSSGIGYSSNGGAVVLSGIGQNTSQSAQRIFDRYSNRIPTISVLPGERIKLLTVDDMQVPIYPEGM